MRDAFSSKKALRIGVIVGVVYGAVYAFASSLIAYQPTVDFAKVYGITQPGLGGVHQLARRELRPRYTSTCRHCTSGCSSFP